MLLEDFPLSSLSLLSKFIKRKIDPIKYAQALKKGVKGSLWGSSGLFKRVKSSIFHSSSKKIFEA